MKPTSRHRSNATVRAALAALLLVLSFLVSSRAAIAAPSRTSGLAWARLPGAESCIGPRDLALAVEDRLGRMVFVSPAHADVIIDGRIEAVPATEVPAAGAPPTTFRVHITLATANGETLGSRDIDGTGACRTLDAHIALVVALLIDPDAVFGPSKPPAPVVAVCAPTTPIRPALPPAPPPKEPWREAITVGPGLALGLLPGVAFGVMFRGEITAPGLFPLELGGAFFPEVHALPPGAVGTSSKGAGVGLSFATLGACPLAWRSDGTRLAACADVSVGGLRAVGYGFAAGSGSGEVVAIVNASIAGRLARRIVGPLEIGAGLSLVVPLRAARVFFVDAATGSQEELFRTSPVAGLFDLTLGLSFP